MMLTLKQTIYAWARKYVYTNILFAISSNIHTQLSHTQSIIFSSKILHLRELDENQTCVCIANWENHITHTHMRYVQPVHIVGHLVGTYVHYTYTHGQLVGTYVQPVLLQFLALLKNYLVSTRMASFFLPPHGLGMRLYKIQITFITGVLWGIVYTFDGHVYH